ncbi:hypothetical protein HIV01_014130 [Lysobacter arenosi]|uniref:Uncharacterized protein n=1 Tax=Lysobacter arenosi TaxID=2795387 RepID=A0ABX7RAI3_9GAMM|nr:hypothetical protein [Lysobacter arenosi]QSX74316.1 hypothetical protein HIV01_014130 [Lysobacter arenosi]
MNIFTNLLFLQTNQPDPHPFDEDDDRYSHGYGNRAASEKYFAPLGHARAARRAEETRSTPELDACAVGCCA